MLHVSHIIDRLHCGALLQWCCLSAVFTASYIMLETSNMFRLKSQIYNLVVVKKEPTYIPAICSKKLKDTMEANNSKLPNAKE
jgi:hypothetical protein